jgi:hypothetical protein
MATKTVTNLEQAQTTVLNAFQGARAELKSLVDRGIDLAEKRTRAMFRYARALTKRLGGAARKAKKKS